MKRVAALYLPQWPIERLRQAGRTFAPPEPAPLLDTAPLAAMVADERAHQCSVPKTPGWRPGARWARDEREAAIARLPAHQRPPMRELGRRSEAAEHPFRALRPDEARGHVPFGIKDRAARDALHEAPQVRVIERRSAPPASGRPPVVTALNEGNRIVVAAACPHALALGLRCGMALTAARASTPGLEVHAADLPGDAAALERLAVALARRFSPTVAVEGADTLLIDLSGVAHLFGGEAAMAARLVRLLARIGHNARIAIADTAGAAWALAHFPPAAPSGADAAVILCPPRSTRAALAHLPVAALRPDAPAIELLRRLGVDRIDALAAMPRGPLARRFAAVLRRLDQAHGLLPEPLDPVIPAEAIACRQGFLEPILTAEAIAQVLGDLVPRLCAALAEAGLGARRIELVAERVDHVPQRLAIGLARPTREPTHLLRLLVRRIEAIEPGFGIDAMTLHIRRADPLEPQPMTERLDMETGPDLGTLVDTLVNRIGEQRLWRTRPVESDVPERSAAPAPPLDPLPRDETALAADDVRRLDRRHPVRAWHPRWPRPARLLRRPERLDHVIAELPDRPPIRFTWRGETHRIVRADGPERIHAEWWKRASEMHAVRDYFRVEDETGRRYWLYRRGDGMRSVSGDLSWWLHGCFG